MSKVYIVISILCYIVAGFLPAYVGSGVNYTGFECLSIGWLTIMSIHYKPLWFLAWLANPFYFLSIYGVLTNKIKSKLIVIFSLFAVVLSALSLFVNSILPNESSMDVPVDVVSGAYLWCISILILFLGKVYNFISRKKNKKVASDANAQNT